MVRKADAFVREGKLDQAIAEYRALVDENPGDSGAANTLGDLYARLGDTGRAIEQYTRLGESEWLQGFSAKAAAFYKKALKVDANCEGALARLGEIAASQSLFVDASRHWTRLLERRRLRGDAEGEAEVSAWLADLKGVRATPRQATSVGMTPRVEPPPLPETVPADLALNQRAQPSAVALPAETAEPATLPAVPSEEATVLSFDANGSGDVVPSADEIPLVVEQFGQVEQFGRLAEEPADAAPPADAQEEWALLSASPLEPSEGDGWFTPNGSGPDVDSQHVVELGQADVDAGATAFASERTEDASAVPEDDWEIVVEVSDDVDTTGAVMAPDASDVAEISEVPEAAVLLELPVPDPVYAVEHMSAVAESIAEPRQVETRDELVDDDEPVDEDDRHDDGALIADLVAASETPSLRFQAAVQLGRIFLQRGDVGPGIEWLERACGVSPPVRDHGLQARYDLAEALERSGDRARALEVLSDLEMDAGSYRDVSARISRLSRVVAT